MKDQNVLKYLEDVLENMPTDWLRLTTHRLDIYDEAFAKVQFLEQFEQLFQSSNSNTSALSKLPTAFDYIRLGHPLSCILEWGIARMLKLKVESVISFSSTTIPILAILRKNLLTQKNTQIVYDKKLPASFDAEVVRRVYGYEFILTPYRDAEDFSGFEGSTVFVSEQEDVNDFQLSAELDFFIHVQPQLGSVLIVNGPSNSDYISEIQHVRRRESIAMTPADCLTALRVFTGKIPSLPPLGNVDAQRSELIRLIGEITNTESKVLIGSSGLSIQYAIMMGLIDSALEQEQGKDIRFIVPPNCYGGTNDQARRVAACLDNVEVVDLPVDGDNDMVQSIDSILHQVAQEDAVPYIIVEIPTNPRVEVPDLDKLKAVLSKTRYNAKGETAVDPVFILDQTFCPNVQFLGETGILSSVRAISYVSGSKFPSGGKCTAGYCVANEEAKTLLKKIEKHLVLCNNEATNLQVELLAEQMPSMNQRIRDAYKNTREFVNFIQSTLPEAKINFVSEELADKGFTPSVFSLDLPTKGSTADEKEAYKRALNLKLIRLMISEIPNESKNCVSYGQLKGCYWTIPATSTQGTTKEGDKDYIARVSLSPNMDLDRHKKVFADFVETM